MTAAAPSVGIVIVNWNAGPQLRRCLTSIAEADWTSVRLQNVVVVDNASTDASVDGLEGSLAIPLATVRNERNRGFGAACNQGARLVVADYVLFLNPDTVLERQSIAAAIAWIHDPAHADTGIVGIQLVDSRAHISRSCAHFPTPGAMVSRALGLDRLMPAVCPDYVMTDWDHRESRYVDHVIGAFYLVRATLFTRLAGFDETFFVYLEDLDFSLRASRVGARSFYLSSARAFHQGGGTSERIRSQRLFYALRSRLQYAHKHFSAAAAAAVVVATVGLEPIVRTVACLWGASPTSLADTVGAYRMLWREGWRP